MDINTITQILLINFVSGLTNHIFVDMIFGTCTEKSSHVKDSLPSNTLVTI